MNNVNIYICTHYFLTDASPSAISVVNKTNSQITIMWINNPTCYIRHVFVIIFSRPDNSSQTFNVDANSTLYTFDGLSPGTKYNVDIYTQYGNGTHQTTSLQPRSVTVTTSKIFSNTHIFSSLYFFCQLFLISFWNLYS